MVSDSLFAFSGLVRVVFTLGDSDLAFKSDFDIVSGLRGDVEWRDCFSADFLDKGIQLGLVPVSELRRLSVGLVAAGALGGDLRRDDFMPKDKLKALLGDILEDGSEFSVLDCGVSRDRRFLVFATVPETKERSY